MKAKLIYYTVLLILFIIAFVGASQGQNIISYQDTLVDVVRTPEGYKFMESIQCGFTVDKPFVAGPSPKLGIVITPQISLDFQKGKVSNFWYMQTEHELIKEGYPTTLNITFDDEYKSQISLPEFHISDDGGIMYYVGDKEKELLKKKCITKMQVRAAMGMLITLYIIDKYKKRYFIDYYKQLK